MIFIRLRISILAEVSSSEFNHRQTQMELYFLSILRDLRSSVCICDEFFGMVKGQQFIFELEFSLKKDFLS